METLSEDHRCRTDRTRSTLNRKEGLILGEHGAIEGISRVYQMHHLKSPGCFPIIICILGKMRIQQQRRIVDPLLLPFSRT